MVCNQSLETQIIIVIITDTDNTDNNSVQILVDEQKEFIEIRSLADPAYTSSIFVHGPLHSYCRYFRFWTVDLGRSVMLRLFFHMVWPCFLRQIVWLSSSSLRNSGMIFSNVLFIVYGISCARGHTILRSYPEFITTCTLVE